MKLPPKRSICQDIWESLVLVTLGSGLIALCFLVWTAFGSPIG